MANLLQSSLEEVPDEVLLEILKYLPTAGLLTVSE